MRNFRYLVIVGKPDSGWTGNTGHLSRALPENHVSRIHSSTFFVCGPQGLIDSACNILHSLGIPDAQIRQENFKGKPPPSPSPGPRKTVGKLVLVRSRRSCDLPEGQTLLEIAEANGISIPSSCRQGQCGTCAVQVLSGRVRMETEAGLSPERKELGCVLACVARVDETVTVNL
jgi:ferredoxin